MPGASPVATPTTTALDGTFRIEEAAYEHTYRLTAHAPGYATTFVDLPPLEADRPTQPVHLVLSKGRRALGTVIDSEGNPVTGAHVELFWPLDQSDFRSSFEPPAIAATTNDRGAFLFAAAAPGEYELRITHPEYAARPPHRSKCRPASRTSTSATSP